MELGWLESVSLVRMQFSDRQIRDGLVRCLADIAGDGPS